MDKLFHMYGFFDNSGKLIDEIPSTSIDEAKEYFNKTHHDQDYLYIEVLY